jgi:hypothetical protein
MRKLWKGVGLGGFVGVLLIATIVPARAQNDLPPLLQGRQEGFS